MNNMTLSHVPIYVTPNVPVMARKKQDVVKAHDQSETHRYVVHFPDHAPREGDPHYVDFEHYRKTHVKDAKCAHAVRTGDDSECSGGLELHHSHIEFSLQNGVDLALLERDYPGVSNVAEVGEWVECADNLEFLCVWHHRGANGKHTATASDYEASHYVRNLIGAPDKPPAA